MGLFGETVMSFPEASWRLHAGGFKLPSRTLVSGSSFSAILTTLMRRPSHSTLSCLWENSKTALNFHSSRWYSFTCFFPTGMHLLLLLNFLWKSLKYSSWKTICSTSSVHASREFSSRWINTVPIFLKRHKRCHRRMRISSKMCNQNRCHEKLPIQRNVLRFFQSFSLTV